ncbi:MAG: polyphosphate kinase 2 [Planctomycetota bacterium]|jgi:polyphosphate kinase 2
MSHEKQDGNSGEARTPPSAAPETADEAAAPPKLTDEVYERELLRMQVELVKLQAWIRHKQMKLVIVFEGRDAAGKGGVIKRIREFLNPRYCRVVSLPPPTDREREQWYFQRYVVQMPTAGEIVLFDRSWYNRAGVERVMGWCTQHEYQEFLRSCPEFERMLCRSGIILVKYWFSISAKEQKRRFLSRLEDPLKRWKLSTMDFQSRARWVDFSRAKDDVFVHTDTLQCPWYVVHADVKKRARLNCISHLLTLIPYEDVLPQATDVELPSLQQDPGYERPPRSMYRWVPEQY